MTRKIIFATVTFSLAAVLSAAAIAGGGGGGGGAVGGGGADEPPVRARGGGAGGGGFGGAAGGGGFGGGAVGGGGGMGGGAAAGGGMGGFYAAQPRVQIGIVMDRVPEPLAAHLNIDASEVILIVNVTPDGPADQAGVQRFDVITHVEGKSPVTPETIREAMQSKEPGEAIALRVLRGGESKEIAVTLAESAQRRLRAVTLFNPETVRRLNEFAPADPREFLEGYVTPDQVRELRQQFRRDWREQRPLIDEHLRRLREETQVLRETFGEEWRKHWREFKLDEESREKLGKWVEGAAERTANALERLAERLEGAGIELEVIPRLDRDATHIDLDVQPRIEIRREVGGVRGMVVHPESEARQRMIDRERRMEREAMLRAREEVERDETRRPGPEMDRRLSGLEERLERMERLMQRLVERDGSE